MFETSQGNLLDKSGRAMQMTGSSVDNLPPTRLAGVMPVQLGRARQSGNSWAAASRRQTTNVAGQ